MSERRGVVALPQLIGITASTGIHFEHLSSPEQKYIVELLSGGPVRVDLVSALETQVGASHKLFG